MSNVALKLKYIPCGECPCGTFFGRCGICPRTKGCILHWKKIISCDDCEYGVVTFLDTNYCSYGCRPVIGNKGHLIPCDQCSAGIETDRFGSRESIAYCKPAGCQCGTSYIASEDVYRCKRCCCGICQWEDTRYCCLCGCECGNCFRLAERSFAILLTSGTFNFGPICCPCVRCFPSIARVYLENGESITMAELQVGDRIQAGE